MKFSEIVEHLGKRGYVTREEWQKNGHNTHLFFGIDNVGWIVWKVDEKQYKQMWTPCLAEINAEDWIIVPRFFEFRL